jgi:hypothetical protein
MPPCSSGSRRPGSCWPVGVTQEEYLATIDILRRMAEKLGTSRRVRRVRSFLGNRRGSTHADQGHPYRLTAAVHDDEPEPQPSSLR